MKKNGMIDDNEKWEWQAVQFYEETMQGESGEERSILGELGEERSILGDKGTLYLS